MIGYDRPSRLQGHQHVLAAELKDEKAVAEALKTVIGKFPELFEEKHFGNVTYHAIVRKAIQRYAGRRAADALRSSPSRMATCSSARRPNNSSAASRLATARWTGWSIPMNTSERARSLAVRRRAKRRSCFP